MIATCLQVVVSAYLWIPCGIVATGTDLAVVFGFAQTAILAWSGDRSMTFPFENLIYVQAQCIFLNCSLYRILRSDSLQEN